MTPVASNLVAIRARIDKAAASCGRGPETVRLVAVGKQQPEGKILEALEAGHRLFGENRVQEAKGRWPALREKYPDIKLHLIGPLQTNKAKDAVALFDMIETIDRPAVADALAGEMEKQGRRLLCLIQVNTGDEAQKAGVAPEGLPALLAYCRGLGLEITGLMCIPPFDDPPALHFALLSKLAGENGLKELSMGMSADFEKAVPLGATYVRVGTALFGDRLSVIGHQKKSSH